MFNSTLYAREFVRKWFAYVGILLATHIHIRSRCFLPIAGCLRNDTTRFYYGESHNKWWTRPKRRYFRRLFGTVIARPLRRYFVFIIIYHHDAQTAMRTNYLRNSLRVDTTVAWPGTLYFIIIIARRALFPVKTVVFDILYVSKRKIPFRVSRRNTVVVPYNIQI